MLNKIKKYKSFIIIGLFVLVFSGIIISAQVSDIQVFNPLNLGGVMAYSLEEDITYTSNSETHCSGGDCWTALYSGTAFEEVSGEWKSLPEIIGFDWLGNEFKLYYKNNPNIYLILQPYVNYANGNNYTFQDIKNIFPNATIKDRIDIERINYKFALNLTVPENLVDNTNYIGFKITEVNGLTWDDVERDGNGIVIKEKYRIDYNDLLESGFTLTRVGKEFRIGNLSANYHNGSLYLDPKVEFNNFTELKEVEYFNDKGFNKLDVEIEDITKSKMRLWKWDREEYLDVGLSGVPDNKRMEGNKLIQEYSDYDVNFYPLNISDGGFEFEVVLNKIPSSNIINFDINSTDLEFYYQPALNIEMNNASCNETDCQGSHRPIDVVGSYAVYHSSKSNNKYMTGKFAHIYRPLIIDANNKTIWAELNIENGIMSIT